MTLQKSKRSWATGGFATAAAGVLLLATAPAASAHVTISPSTAEAGSYSALTFSVGHGCEGSPTTELAIQIPEEITNVTPTRNPLYEIDVAVEELDEPVEGGHGELTERTAEVIYTAETPLPDDQRDTVELQVQLPEDAAGETLYFPVVQTCETGEAAWVQRPDKGEDDAELDTPAPAIQVAAVGAEDNSAPAETAEDVSAGQQTVADQTGSTNTLSVVALIIGAVGLIFGLLALLRGRKGSQGA